MRARTHRDPDSTVAAAEAHLDQLDEDGEDLPVEELDPSARAVGDRDDMHIEEDGAEPELGTGDDADDGDDLAGHPLADCIDSFAEAFNGRDLDAVADCVAEDVEAPGLGGDAVNLHDELQQLWEHTPTAVVTRGTLDEQPVGVIWAVGDDGSWWRVAPLFFDVTDDGRAGVIELGEDVDVLSVVDADEPEAEWAEGLRWIEWEEGVGD